MATVESFRVEVPDADIADLRDRLRRTRWAADYDNDSWRYGVEEGWLRWFVDEWIAFDWRAAEAAINAFPQFRTVIDDVPIHFIHVRGKGVPGGSAPMPLILTHGWPWTFWDYHATIGPLADPASYGGDPADAFDVVVPSLPGFGFSNPLRRSGIGAQETADLWARLMTDVLGYQRFAAQGGDWGAIVTANLAHAHADVLIGAHLSMAMLLTAGRSQVTAADYGPDEAEWFERMNRRIKSAASHVAVHTNDPQTLAYALNDSPAGLAAWLMERRRAWSDNDGDVLQAFTLEHLLTTASIYWFTQTIGTSMRYYAEWFGRTWQPRHDRAPTLQAPTGIAVFPQELILLPRSLAERHANLVHWSVQPRGGHFAAAEVPDLLVADVQAMFATLR